MSDTLLPPSPAAESEPKRKPSELQNPFLNAHCGKHVTVYLVSGIRLTGVLRAFDQFTVLLDNNGTEQLVFKHVISTVSPEIGKPDVRTTAARGAGLRKRNPLAG